MERCEFDFPLSYPYCKFDFIEWNPVQQKCVPFFTEDCNLVVSASTASGKTAIAEAVMGYGLAMSESSKVVYVSPMKAIGYEKHAKWKRHPTFGKFASISVSSESQHCSEEFEESRLIVSTVESMAVRCRARDRWISDVSVLVLDESHLVGDESRGAGCEAMVMDFTWLNPNARVVFLSGTMGNCVEMAKWLKSCNGKQTRFVTSSWRPSELTKHVRVSDSKKSMAADVLDEVGDGSRKTLVFVQSKHAGEWIVKELNAHGVPAAFYHAGLPQSTRKRMTADFTAGMGGLNTIVCTSSLSTGVSL